MRLGVAMPSAHAAVGDARVAKMSRYGVLAPQAPVHILGGAIVGRLVTEVLAQAPEVMAGSDPEATHDMRVAIRRLRNALDTFGPPHHGGRARRFAKATRRLGKRLGAVRDADVQLAALRKICGLRCRRRGRGHRVRDRLARTAARRRPRLRSARDRRVRAVAARGRGARMKATPADVVQHRAAAFLARGMHAVGGARDDELHAMRIAGKRLRYNLEFFASRLGPSHTTASAG